MQAQSDAELLVEYANLGKETAFAELVQRHTNLVYSSATRQVGSAAIAAEVTQQAFVSLARQSRSLAGQLDPHASLAGWLCRTARNLSANHKRDEFRRNIREREAMHQLAQDPETAPDWQFLSSVLDDAMGELSDGDYDAVVMRFYQNVDLRSVGRALGVSDDAAQKRVTRALDRLRALLSRRGITGTATAISVVISANAVQSAPVGLAAAISTAVVPISLASSAGVPGIATKIIAMTTLQKAVAITVLASAIGTALYQGHQASVFREKAAAEATRADEMQQLQLDYARATNELASLRSGDSGGIAAAADPEVLKLRGEVERLRRQLEDQPQFNGVIGTVVGLKRKLKEMPDKNIPEIQYLDDDKWLRMIAGPGYGFSSAARFRPPPGPAGPGGPGGWEVQFDDEESVRRALAQVRREAKTQFSGRVQNALQSYSREHQGELPSDIMQLKRYLPDVDDTTLQRYKMMQTGNISNLRPAQYVTREKAPVDSDFDTLIQIGLKGYLTTGVGRQQSALGWSGDLDLASLTPEQKDTYEKSRETSRQAKERIRAVRESRTNSFPSAQ